MGPRHLCRGIVIPVDGARKDRGTSMGPRHLCRGIPRRHRDPARGGRTSMGPRHLCRGIFIRLVNRPRGPTKLQWGHGISAVESSSRSSRRSMSWRLQWGHGISAVESSSSPVLLFYLWATSMGPRHLCRGIVRRLHTAGTPISTSMGPRHLCRGIVGAPKTSFVSRSDFNGATASLPWNQRSAEMARSAEWSTSMGPRHLCRGIRNVRRRGGAVHGILQWGHGISAVESGC